MESSRPSLNCLPSKPPQSDARVAVARIQFWYDAPVPADNTSQPLLNERIAAFVQRHCSMNVAARDADNRPVLARGLGCRVAADRRWLTVFLSATHAAPVLDCLKENGTMALAVSRPTTHETLQFKGRVVSIAPVSADDRAAMAAYQASFAEELAAMGYREEFARMVLAGGEDGVAVSFEPETLFDQTPGPNAGAKL